MQASCLQKNVTVKDKGEPPRSTEASMIIIVHALPETAKIKDNEFYDIDGDKVLIKSEILTPVKCR